MCIVCPIDRGWVAEWSIAAVLKTVEGRPSGSSNLSPSAINASLTEAFFIARKKMVIKTNAMRILENANIPFTAYEYDPKQGIDAKSVALSINKPQEQVFKTLVTQSPTQQHSFEHFVFVIPANQELDLKKAANAACVKSLEMLPLKKLLPLTGYIHGGCSPVGMKKSFPAFIDETALLFDTFCVSGGKIGLTLELNAEKLANTIDAKFSDLTTN